MTAFLVCYIVTRTRGELTSQMLGGFFDEWDQNKAHECVLYVVFLDNEVDFIHWNRADEVSETEGKGGMEKRNRKRSYLGTQHVVRHK